MNMVPFLNNSHGAPLLADILPGQRGQITTPECIVSEETNVEIVPVGRLASLDFFFYRELIEVHEWISRVILPDHEKYEE